LECAPQTGERPSQVEYRPIRGFHVWDSGFKLDRPDITDRGVKALPVTNLFDEKRKSFDDILMGFVIAQVHW